MEEDKKEQQSMTHEFLDENFVKYCNLGTRLFLEGNLIDAKTNYLRALALNSESAEVYNGLGMVSHAQNRFEDAIKYYQLALAIKPDLAEVSQNLGTIFRFLKEERLAIEVYRKSLGFRPDNVTLLSELFYTQQHCCDWTDYHSNVQRLADNESEQNIINPFVFLAISDSAERQLQCARNYFKHYQANMTTIKPRSNCHPHKRIRLAYISGDFHEHPVSYLMAGVFEKHNRNKFELIAISLEEELSLKQKIKNAFAFSRDGSQMTSRIKASFDRFINVGGMSDREIALLIEHLEIDIAIDLMGLTFGHHFGVFACRPAPVQVTYLGYPGTLGHDCIDYILADPYLVPPEYQSCYTEKVVYLPDCFQANDDKRKISPNKPVRLEVGLPESGFVFCAFNNSHKINPVFFDIWMRLLKAVPGSVLWMVANNERTKSNLLDEAKKRDVNPERIIFANRLPYAEHLARFQLADLFLDTLPFNAGAIASDALWAGVPVLTCSGEAFAARMAGSLLHAIGLPELIAENLKEYEALAVKLASTPEFSLKIRAKLAENRATYPLFDTDRFRYHVEAAYIEMWERYEEGRAPASFSVPVKV